MMGFQKLHDKFYTPPITRFNWYSKTAAGCEEVCDALLRKKKGHIDKSNESIHRYWNAEDFRIEG